MGETAGAAGAGQRFVGRRAETTRLLQRWHEAIDRSEGWTVLLGGEPGIGKTALVRRICDSAAADGATVLCGRGDEPTAPYQPWLAALRPVGFTETFRAIVTDVSDPATGRTLVFEAVLDAVAAAAPAVVVLDDVHRADESSLALARHVAEGSGPIPLLLALVYRDTDLRPGLARTLSDLARSPRVERMSLVGLTSSEVAELAEIDEPRWLSEQTGGNPFFVRAIAGHRGEGPPPLVAELVTAWLGDLSGRAQEAVRVAAVCGRVAEVRVVEALLGGAALDELDEATAAGLLAPEGDEAYVFVHDLVRECIVDALPPARRSRLHGSIANLLDASGAPAARVEQHRIGAGGPAAWSAAVDAADRARSAHAYETAAAHRQAALELAAGAAERYDIAVALAEDLALTGSVAGERGALLAAIDSGRALGDQVKIAAALARLPLSLDAAPDVAATIDEVLAALPRGDSAARARLLLRDFYEQANTQYPIDVRPTYDAAVAMAARIGDGATLARAVVTKAIYFPELVSDDDLDVLTHHEAAMAAVFGARTLRRSRAIRVTLRVARADIDGARRVVAGLVDGGLSESCRWTVTEFRALEAFLTGRFDEALRLSAEARRLGRSLGEDVADANHHLLAAHVSFERGDPVEADSFERFLRGAVGERSVVLTAKAAAHQGDTARAQRIVADTDVDDLVRRVSWAPLLFAFADAVVAAGDRTQAAALYDALASHAGSVVIPPLYPSVCLGAADRLLGGLAELAGRRDDARRLYTSALAIDTQIGADVWAAHDRHHLGRLLLDDEPERAAALLDAAASEARRMGMRVLEATIAMARDRSVFRRQVDGWLVSYAGRVARLPRRRGFDALAVLLARPGEQVGALDLAGGGSWDRPPILDARAKREYRRRLAELDAELDGAATDNDPVRGDRARHEREALLDELRRAVGLSGRDRVPGADTERARLNVTKAIRRALVEIEAVHPPLAAHLGATVRTGLFCSYNPDPRHAPNWRTS